jgi:hypothetical protein
MNFTLPQAAASAKRSIVMPPGCCAVRVTALAEAECELMARCERLGPHAG